MKREIPFGKPVIGAEEKQAALEVMESGIMVHGPRIKEFEEAFGTFTHATHVVGVSSCTAGLHLAYFAFEIGSGDEVIVPAMTHTATAHAVELTGAKAVFVDADAITGNISIDQIEACITARTKAISVVHYLGMPADMIKINALADRYNLKVVEDCALSPGACINGTHTGLFGTCGCFSFYPVKHMTTAEGGALITSNAALAEKIELIRAFGVDRHHGVRKIPGIYDVKVLGFNYRMSEIHAAIGVEQIKRLPGFIAQRKTNYETLSDKLRDIDEIDILQSSNGVFQSSYYCHLAILKGNLAARRPDIMAQMRDRGIGTSIYYPQPVPRMTYYRKKYGYQSGAFPNAERIADAGIALPVGPHLTADDMHYIGNQFKQILARK